LVQSKALKAILVSQDQLVQPALLAFRVQLVQLVQPVLLARLVHRESKAFKVQRVLLALKAIPD
jgi:hypothetical protein